MSWDDGSKTETLTFDQDTMTWSGDTENLKYAGDGSTPNGNVNNFTFTMPASDVTIEITMLYNITFEYEGNAGEDGGTVTATVNGNPATQASPGDTVVLNITTNVDYALNWIAYQIQDSLITIEPVDGVYSFEMPSGNVRIRTSFERN